MSTQDRQSDQSETPMIEKPVPDEEGVETANKMLAEAYRDDRPTAVLPGSGGTVTGTAVSDWLDDEGNSKFVKQPDGD